MNLQVPGSLVVLVVSDDDAFKDEATFSYPEGVGVETAVDAREAIAKIAGSAPSVVVVEIRSGSAGGFGLARDMSQMTATRDIPILMVLEREQDMWLAREAGADRCLIKPVVPSLLVRESLALAAPAAAV